MKILGRIYAILAKLREEYHPLFHLRKNYLFRALTLLFNFPIAIRFPDISHNVYVSFSKNLSWVLTGGGVGEEAERNNFIKIITFGELSALFDVGANIGLYGFIFNSIRHNSKVFMFEADCDNARLIEKTIDRYKTNDVQLVQVGVSDVDGTAYFYKDDITGATGSLLSDPNESFIFRHHRHKPRQVTIETKTLDSMSAMYKWFPDIIKIDVEGSELAVLQGAKKTIREMQPAIIFECDRENQKLEIQSLLQLSGYLFYDMTTLMPINVLVHNNLALHRTRHQNILEKIKT
jgi:FkbM family methyltransferase